MGQPIGSQAGVGAASIGGSDGPVILVHHSALFPLPAALPRLTQRTEALLQVSGAPPLTTELALLQAPARLGGRRAVTELEPLPERPRDLLSAPPRPQRAKAGRLHSSDRESGPGRLRQGALYLDYGEDIFR